MVHIQYYYYRYRIFSIKIATVITNIFIIILLLIIIAILSIPIGSGLKLYHKQILKYILLAFLQLIFEAVRGGSTLSDIAIDEVTYHNGTCPPLRKYTQTILEERRQSELILCIYLHSFTTSWIEHPDIKIRMLKLKEL